VYSQTAIVSSELSATRYLGSAEDCTAWVRSASRLLPKTIH
jgi:hypothetical protein